MYRLLALIPILLLALAACSPPVPVSGTGATGTQPSPATVASPTSLPAPSATPLPASTSAPSLAPTGMASGATQTAGSAPMIPYHTATPVVAAGWIVYTNPDLQVSLSVPADWSIDSTSTGATFTPPQNGVPIVLAVSTSSPAAEPLPNTRCTTIVNEHGVSIDRCFDTIAFAYDATFTINGHTLSLSTTQHGDINVYDAMLNSVQPAA
jgi:hypothetical protein